MHEVNIYLHVTEFFAQRIHLTFWHRSCTFKFWHILYVKCE